MKTKNESTHANIKVADKSPIHEAIAEQDIEALNKRCKGIKSEDVHTLDGFDHNGDTPLICAIKKQNEDIIDILLQSGSSPNKTNSRGETPLTTAIQYFSSNIITMLIEEGAKVNQVNAHGESPLKLATKLDNQECITLLTENGATFAQKQNSASAPDNSHNVSQYKNYLVDLIKTKQKNKSTNISLENFYKEIIGATSSYLGKDLTKTNNPNSIEKVFTQLQDLNKKSTEKDILNLTRKVIATTSSTLREHFIKDGDTDSIHRMSKAESVVEEEITKIKEKIESSQTIKTESVENKDKEKQQEHNTQDFYEKIHKAQDLFEIIEEKILCRTTNHDVVLSETQTIKPHHPRTANEAERILSITKSRLSEEKLSSKETVKKQIKEIEDIIEAAKKEKRDITNNEGALIDKILRPGKSERIHILHFPSRNMRNIFKDLSVQALETGATIHFFDYHENVENKNDLIYTGIANVNKLLDDGIHPDRIILQGIGPEGDVAKSTAMQFAKREIYLTQIYIDSDAISKSNHRQISLTDPLKPEKDTPTAMKEFISSFEKSLRKSKKNTSTTNIFIFTPAKSWISLSQRANLFIKSIQNFLHNESKYRNMPLPKERVENIIGITDIDESKLES
ncbi:MAG: ankyrin repeat domain-containing protein [Alphaproteobacteria bacterium]|nr:ankyrin repeat domain-containing protein [Alphaproteobacteria bacterium]